MKKKSTSRPVASTIPRGSTHNTGPSITREREQLYEIDEVPIGGINDLSTGEVKRFLSSIVKTLTKENENRMMQYIDSIRSDLVMDIKNIRNELHQTQSNFQLRLEQIETEIQSVKQFMEEQINIERNKRLILTKKVYKKLNTDIDTHYKHFITSSNELKESISNNNEETRAISKDILVIRENLDELLLHRFGYIPSSSILTLGEQEKNNNQQHNGPAYDATTVLETLATRVKDLEGKITTLNHKSEVNYSQPLTNRADSSDDEDGLFSQEDGRVFTVTEEAEIRPEAEPASTSRLEASISELKTELATIQEKIDSVERISLEALHLGKEPVHQKSAAITPITKSSTPDSDSKKEDEMKKIQKKLKALSENSSNAVKSLAAGLHDVHETTLKIYKWGSGVHDAFQVASTKMGFKHNICPNLIDDV